MFGGKLLFGLRKVEEKRKRSLYTTVEKTSRTNGTV